MTKGKDPKDILTCPNCGTRYRAPGAVLGRPDAMYRCARCQHVFSLGSTSDQEIPSGLDFDLGDEPTVDDTEPALATPSPGAPVFLSTASDIEQTSQELPPEPAFTTPRAQAHHPEDSQMASPRTLSSLQLGVRFEALVLVVFGAIALYLVAYPHAALELVAHVPFLESTLGMPPQLLDQVYLANLRGEHERLKGGVPAFVIAGQVVNDSSTPVGAIQVEGRLYDDTKEVARKTVFAGTRASRRLVKVWAPAEIEMFEKISPPKSYKLAPGKADKFLIIFQQVPDDIREFGCQLVAARPVAGR